MRLRVRSRTGVQTHSVDDSISFSQLCAQLSASKISSGFPPRPIDADAATPISSLLRDGDMLIVQPATDAPSTATAATPLSTSASASSASAAVVDLTKTPARSNPVAKPKFSPSPTPSDAASIASQGEVLIRTVPDDNACLFRCIAKLTGAGDRPMSYFRGIVSSEVLRRPDEYSSAVLGKAPADYAAWIQSDHAWGGAIELAIFARFFRIQFAAFDVRSRRLDRYAQDCSFDTVAFLVYDGIHYNYVAVCVAGSLDVTQFDPTDAVVQRKVEALGEDLHRRRQFTNTASFNLRCGQCGLALTGEKHALEHAKLTGHTQFDESS